MIDEVYPALAEYEKQRLVIHHQAAENSQYCLICHHFYRQGFVDVTSRRVVLCVLANYLVLSEQADYLKVTAQNLSCSLQQKLNNSYSTPIIILYCLQTPTIISKSIHYRQYRFVPAPLWLIRARA